MLKTFYFYENGMARKTIYKCLYKRNKILLHGLVKLCKYRVYKHWEKEKVSYSIYDERDVKKGRIQFSSDGKLICDQPYSLCHLFEIVFSHIPVLIPHRPGMSPQVAHMCRLEWPGRHAASSAQFTCVRTWCRSETHFNPLCSAWSLRTQNKDLNIQVKMFPPFQVQ